jgi:hypothetical protein
MASSAGAEAYVILNLHKGARVSKWTGPNCADYLARRLLQGIYIFLRLRENRRDFSIDDPVPPGDSQYDTKLQGIYTIFVATVDDPGFVQGGLHNVVTDGNYQLGRRLAKDELRQKLNNSAGRPQKKPSAKETHLGQKKQLPANKKKSTSRCAAMNKTEEIIKRRKGKIGGLFGTLTIKLQRNHKEGNEILHLAEMLSTENNEYREECAKACKKNKIKFDGYAHDCGCKIKAWFEGKYCTKCYLDGYHAKKHKCKMKAFKRKGYNSMAAEQLWGRLDQLGKILTHANRRHYRMLLRHYCIWRNDYVRGTSRSDINPLTSRRNAKRHP